MKKILVLIGLGVVLSGAPAAAYSTDPLIEGAKQCTRHLPRYEREYGIPTHLLSAIASTESGRYHQGLKIAVPWPWTINAEGKGYYYDSKAEAIAAARKMKSQGIKSMDVGCMQVNLMHHPEAFASLEQAFEPQNNVAYAASFLRNLYEQDKSWKKAASAYHSRTPSRGDQYVGNVYNRWYKIVDKLREARLQTPSASFAQNEPVPASSMVKRIDPATQTLQDAPLSHKPEPKKVAALPEQRGTKPAAYKSPRMNSIQLSKKESSRENGIIVVRPDIKVVDEPLATQLTSIAPATPEITVAQATPHEAKVIRLDNSVKSSIVKKSGPNFIFDN